MFSKDSPTEKNGRCENCGRDNKQLSKMRLAWICDYCKTLISQRTNISDISFTKTADSPKE